MRRLKGFVVAVGVSTLSLGSEVQAQWSLVSGMAGRSPPASVVGDAAPAWGVAPALPEMVCVGPGACATGGCYTSGECWERIKSWLLFRSTKEKYLPCLRPTPWRPPLYAWFPCQEGPGVGCNGAGGVCGGPPITYYYPQPGSDTPAPSAGSVQNHPMVSPAVRNGLEESPPAPASVGSSPSFIRGTHFASVASPTPRSSGLRGRTTSPVPAASAQQQAVIPVSGSHLPSRMETPPFGYYQSQYQPLPDPR